MKRILVVSLLAMVAVVAAAGGTIHGQVQARPRPGAEEAAAGGKYDSRKFKFAERINYESMHEFVVFLEGAVGTNSPVAPPPSRVVTRKSISQKGAVFSPRVLPVVVGTTVEWPNEDEIFHNVFSISETKEFDLGLYKKPDIGRVTFDKAGRVDAFCSIHSAMNCTILVLENPFFSGTDEAGRYSIPNVPPGTYQLKAWHERLPSQRRQVTVTEGGDVRVDFTLGLGGSVSP